jgi:basic amino acid/polyamine antiporter, APA family
MLPDKVLNTLQKKQPQIGLITAAAFVVASMIGTGIFTSLGFQVIYIDSVLSILLLWMVGGILALCGALSYGELGAALPRSGGEYHLLSKIFHPAVGFLSGWVSSVLSFAAPAALASVAFASYLRVVFPVLPPEHLAALLVVVIGIIHLSSIRIGALFHDFFTLLKVLLILIFIVAAFSISTATDHSLIPTIRDFSNLFSSGFAVSLVFVSYSYFGWNGAIYIVNELKNPNKHLPLSLFAGTMLVLLLYVLLNYAFLYTVPMAELAGQIEIGFLSASNIFGPVGADIMAVTISLLLVSTVSAFVYLGPRIAQVMGEDYYILRWLRKKSSKGAPVHAIIFQIAVTLIFIYTATFEQVFIYTGFTISLMTSMTVLGVFVLRYRQPGLPRPYKTWGYPFTPALFLLINGWILYYLLVERPLESFVGIAIVSLGIIFYFLNLKMSPATELKNRYL